MFHGGLQVYVFTPWSGWLMVFIFWLPIVFFEFDPDHNPDLDHDH